ncbi:MAG: hypothetical protein ACREIW_06260, partial [Chthoniobacterales bacterium]
ITPNDRIAGHPISAFRFFYPTVLGIELFMWGLGYGDETIDAFTPQLLECEKLPATLKPLDVRLGRVRWG